MKSRAAVAFGPPWKATGKSSRSTVEARRARARCLFRITNNRRLPYRRLPPFGTRDPEGEGCLVFPGGAGP